MLPQMEHAVQRYRQMPIASLLPCDCIAWENGYSNLESVTRYNRAAAKVIEWEQDVLQKTILIV